MFILKVIRYVCLLWFLFVQAESELHSLSYIYTALSKPLNLPGVHEFTAMGLLDGKMIDYYDSVDKKKVPKQPWMKERMEPDYWDKGTQSRKSKEQWFKVNVDILMERMRQNSSDVHILQWRHGCTVDQQSDNSFKFIGGVDHYSYDGNDFLSFDDANMRWIAPIREAEPTKLKWDNVPILNQYTKGYLEKECVDWLKKFSEYGDAQFRTSSPPKVHVFAKKCREPKNVVLTCMATGFFPKDVTLEIRKNRVSLTDKNGVKSTGVRPNNDDTYQIRKSVDVPMDDPAEYDCYVAHLTLTQPLIRIWDKGCIDCSSGIAVTVAVVVSVILIVVALVLFGLYKKKIIVFPPFQNRPDQQPPPTTNNGIEGDTLLMPVGQNGNGVVANGVNHPANGAAIP